MLFIKSKSQAKTLYFSKVQSNIDFYNSSKIRDYF
jgi:hypothetical protein